MALSFTIKKFVIKFLVSLEWKKLLKWKKLENEICVHIGVHIRLVNQLDCPWENRASLSFPISNSFAVIYEQYKDFPTN